MGSAHSASDGNEKRKFRSSLSIPSLIDKFHSNTRNGNPVVSQFAFSSDFSFTNPSFRKRCFDVRIWFAPIATSRLDLSAGANLYRFRPTSRLPRKVHTGTGYVLGGETREQSRPYALLRASAVSPWLTVGSEGGCIILIISRRDADINAYGFHGSYGIVLVFARSIPIESNEARLQAVVRTLVFQDDRQLCLNIAREMEGIYCRG